MFLNLEFCRFLTLCLHSLFVMFGTPPFRLAVLQDVCSVLLSSAIAACCFEYLPYYLRDADVRWLVRARISPRSTHIRKAI